MIADIKQQINSGNGNTIIYTAVLAAVIANAMPTPADAIYFWRQQIDKEQLEAGKITPKQYWSRDVFGYYFYTAAWYATVLGVLAAAGGDYKTKARILLGLMGAGLVVGVIAKNIERDNKVLANKKP